MSLLFFVCVLVLGVVAAESATAAKRQRVMMRGKLKRERERGERESTTVKDRFEYVLDTHDDDDHESWPKTYEH